MSYPKNKSEWWTLVDQWWDQIVIMASDQLDLDGLSYEIPGNPGSPITGRTVIQELIHLKQTQNSKIARYFNAIWGLAPDSYAYSKSGWGQLCDLCSEEYVLHEDE